MKRTFRHLISGAAILLFFFVAVASSNDDKDVEKEIAESEQSTPAIQVSAEAIAQEYEANEVAADEKYKGKVVQVTGRVDNIAKDFSDDIYITLATTADDFSISKVRCTFSKDHTQDAAALTKGGTVTIKGKCTGLLMGDVIVKGSSVVK